MPEETQTPNSPYFGNFRTYFVSLYLGLFLMLIGFMSVYDNGGGIGFVFLALGFILLLVAMVFAMIILYHLWEFVIRMSRSAGLTPSVQTAGQAVGFMFIPLFNFYWVFISIGKLPKDINALAEKGGFSQRLPEGLGISIAILTLLGVIPIIGYVTGTISGFILYPMLLYQAAGFCQTHLSDLRVTAAPIAEPETGVTDLASTNDYSALFNLKKYGINYPVGIGLFLALILAKITWIIIPLQFSAFYYYTQSFIFLFAIIALDVIYCALFLLISHRIENKWLLVVMWGLAGMVISVGRRALQFTTLDYLEEIGVGYLVNPANLISGFIMSALFMAGIVLAIRYWGTKVWSVIAGSIGGHVVFSIIWGIISLITLGHTRYWSFQNFIINTINYAIFGAAIYYGIYFHLKARQTMQSPVST